MKVKCNRLSSSNSVFHLAKKTILIEYNRKLIDCTDMTTQFVNVAELWPKNDRGYETVIGFSQLI